MKSLRDKIAVPQTLRGRLSVWYFSSTFIVFLVLSITLSTLLWVTLQNQIDHHLLTVINEARQIVENNQDADRKELLKNLVSTQGMTVILLSPDGDPILQTNSPDLAVTSEHLIQQVNSGEFAAAEPTNFTAGDMRFSTVPVTESGGRGVLAVGYSVNIIEHTFWKIVAITALVVILLLLPLNYVGYKLLSNYLSPLEAIANASGKIANTKSLSVRIPAKNMTTELKAIAAAYNQMLSKLQSIFQKEQRFFSDAAHELKTPLAVLRSQAESLSLSGSSKKKVLGNIDSIAEIIQDLLLISRIETQGDTKLTKVSLSRVMDEFVDLTKALGTEKHLSVNARINKDVFIHADKRLLRRAIINVIQNAITYSVSGGKIYIELAIKSKGDGIEVVVRDTGVGIAKKDLAHIFDRFYRGNAKIDTKGTGLGLAITKAVIENMGGSVQVKSKIGKGAEVKISFP